MLSLFKKKQPTLEFKNIRAFGKLPGFADFVRFRSADTQAIKIDSWLNLGLSSLMQQGKHDEMASDWEMSIFEQADGFYNLITIVNSQDKSGRFYPFVLLAQVQNPWLNDYRSSFPLLFQALFYLAKDLQKSDINSQQALIDAVLTFEKKSIALSKRELLEERINALKNLTQDQAWGGWSSDWKMRQVSDLRNKTRIELPMGSTQSSTETCYWLQLMEDLRDLNEVPLNYYWLNSVNSKKIIIELGESKMIPFQNLFKTYSPGIQKLSVNESIVYDGTMTLLEALYYWQQVKM